MNKIPEVRLGGSYSTLKSHVWFKDYDWVIIININFIGETTK